MKNPFSLAALPLAAAALALATPVHAQTFQTYLDGAQEPSSSTATGFGTVILNAGGPTGEFLLVSENISGLSSPLTEIHIHGPAAPGFDGPILYNIASADKGDPLNILGKTSFSFTNFEINLPGVVTASNGSTFAQASQVAFLDAGVDYVNVHTVNTLAARSAVRFRPAIRSPRMEPPLRSASCWLSAVSRLLAAAPRTPLPDPDAAKTPPDF